MHNLTGIYWIKNESRYLPEYLEFHLMQGFDHFIFYDNNSDDNTYEILEPYIFDGLVEMRMYPAVVRQASIPSDGNLYPISLNYWLMRYCIAEQKKKSRWIHFHSIDERVFSPTGKPLPEVLKEYEFEDIGGVCVNWVQLHSGGVIERPKGLIIENYFRGQTEDPMRHVKTIIRPDKCNGNVPTPHIFGHPNDIYSVNEKFEKQHDSHNWQQYTFDKFMNIHYATMSKDEFDIKYNKGVLDVGGGDLKQRARVQEDWDYYHNNGDKEYRNLVDWILPVKQALEKRYEGREHLLQYINH